MGASHAPAGPARTQPQRVQRSPSGDTREADPRWRIVLLDANEVVRAGLARLLGREADLELVGSAATLNGARDLLRHAEPDVIILVDGPEQTEGPAACRELVAARPDARVLVLSADASDERVRGFLDAGAHGYLTRGIRPGDLAPAVRAVAQGGAVLAPSIAERVLVWARDGAAEDRMDLSAVDRQILALVARGQSDRTIAEGLGVSASTVKTHLRAVKRRLGATRRADAVAAGIVRGLIPCGDEQRASHPRAPSTGLDGAPREHERPGAGPLRVLVVDDREVVREGTVALLAAAPDIEVVGTAVAVEDALESALRLDPDLVLVDARAPRMIDLGRSMAERRIRARLVALALRAGEDLARHAVMAGARPCVVEGATASELARAVRSAARRPSRADASVAVRAGGDPLRPMERSVLRLMSEGRSILEIAEGLGLSRHNARRYLRQIYQRLGVGRGPQAVAEAMRRGLL